MSDNTTTETYTNVNRLELIDYGRGGRVYTNTAVELMDIRLQDDGHTLKIFIWGGDE